MIRGTKRPCKSCAGRMGAESNEGNSFYIDYNHYSGFFFMDCLRQQLKRTEYQAAKKSLVLLRSVPCYKSQLEIDSYSYDTESSDSDSENSSSGYSCKGADYSKDDILPKRETKRRKRAHDDSIRKDGYQLRSSQRQKDKKRRENRDSD